MRAWDNLPVLSYFLLRGRCRSCGVAFSPRYALVEALTGVISAVMFWTFVARAPGVPDEIRLGRYLVYFTFAGVLIVLSFIDLDTKRLPDVITLPSTPILFFATFAAHDVPWQERAIGAVAGYLAVRVISDVYYYVRKREGLGLGDGKLLAVIGAVLGWRALPVVIFLGSFTGIVVTVPLLLWARRRARGHGGESAAGAPDGRPEGTAVRHTEVPFGPFLSLSALIYLLGAQPLVEVMTEFLGAGP